VTDDVNGQNRAAVAAVRALAAAGIRPWVTVSTRRSVAGASRHTAGTVAVPPAGTEGYAGRLKELAASGRFAAVLPASDVALLALGGGSAELVDKAALAARAESAGVPTPPTTVFDDTAALLAGAGALRYPVIVKPATKTGAGSQQAFRADSPGDLCRVGPDAGRLVVQPFETAGIRSVSGVVWDGALLAVCHQRYERIWPLRAGVSCAAVTVSADLALERRLLPLLAGHRGIFQVQLVGPYLLDVNPRAYGSMTLAVAAGANLPAIACAAATGRSDGLVRSRPGVAYRWLEGDLRHLAQALRTGQMSLGEAVRAARPRRGTAHSLESATDPGPLLARLAYAMRGAGR
jgi:predicted ATP-grasp superfamily ATP-dependent carboligase